MALRDKLVALTTEGEPLDTAALISDWQQAVVRLQNFIQRFLTQYVDQNLGRLDLHTSEVEEAELGSYSIEQWSFTAGDEIILFRPFGRLVNGASGRVDVYRQGNILDGYVLLRMVDDTPQKLSWIIVDRERRPATFIGQVVAIKPHLTAETLEMLLESLLP